MVNIYQMISNGNVNVEISLKSEYDYVDLKILNVLHELMNTLEFFDKIHIKITTKDNEHET